MNQKWITESFSVNTSVIWCNIYNTRNYSSTAHPWVLAWAEFMGSTIERMYEVLVSLKVPTARGVYTKRLRMTSSHNQVRSTIRMYVDNKEFSGEFTDVAPSSWRSSRVKRRENGGYTSIYIYIERKRCTQVYSLALYDKRCRDELIYCGLTHGQLGTSDVSLCNTTRAGRWNVNEKLLLISSWYPSKNFFKTRRKE